MRQLMVPVSTQQAGVATAEAREVGKADKNAASQPRSDRKSRKRPPLTRDKWCQLVSEGKLFTKDARVGKYDYTTEEPGAKPDAQP